MYKLLIVDDEEWIRRRLIDTIKWDSIGIRDVLEAEDGRQALQSTLEAKPDIIITDIRMPDLSGLDFIHEIKKHGMNPRVVFLSGYDDFEYAQRALKLGAYDYVLKPAEGGELLGIVQRCIADIEDERKKKAILKDLQEKLKRDRPVLKERFLFDLLNGYVDEQAIRYDLEYFNIPAGGEYRCACIVIQPDDDSAKKPDVHLMCAGIKDIAAEFYSMTGKCESVFMQFGEIAFVLFTKEEDGEALALTEENSRKIQSVVEKLFGITVTIGIGEFCSDVLDLAGSFEQAKQAVLYRSFLGGNKVYRYDGVNDESRARIKFAFDADEWFGVLKTQDADSLEQHVDQLVRRIAEQEIKPVDLKSLYTEIIMGIVNTSYGFEKISETYPSFNLEFFTHLDKLKSPDGFRESLLAMLGMLSGHIRRSASDNKRKVIQLVIEYIEQHYREPIVLTDVAGEVFLNPTYLCKIFKLETGQTFSKYIMNYRIKKAIEFMQDPTLKIYEIANMVGYNDVQYFTKIFKTLKGMSPTQYRDKII